MGSIFNIDLARASEEDFLDWCRDWPGQVVGTHLAGNTDYRRAAYTEPAVLLMGNEQSGLPDTTIAACSDIVKIPVAGRADSLNLAIATGIMLYEMRRARLKL